MTTTRPANRLIDETSPYLQQHAYNPVDWYPWCDEAFAKARAEDKPLLVSIGYSACHWCHVMEHESFEDEATAEIMNRHFVNIKVDMEERPDVDQIYMSFVQLTTGRGGWPMNVFITPDKRPFFGGTYFPPSPRYGMPSWKQILASIADAYRDRREELETSANEIVGELRRLTIPGDLGELTVPVLDAAFETLSRHFDPVNGGFGGAPKFPPSMTLDFLLRYHYRKGIERALEIVQRTCDKMAGGGIYDQLGGGFHRYSVDAVWLVPHFEKMLYDNAQLIRTYVHLFQITREERYREIAVETLEYICREMLDPSGAFYSTQDADSEGEEGKFFVWTPAEVERAVGAKDAPVLNAWLGVTSEGNFEGSNILNLKHDLSSIAADAGLSDDEARRIVDRGRARMFQDREKRIKPHRDEKVLTAWNGLMLAAFADAAAALGDQKYLDVAVRNAKFLLEQMRFDGRLFRTWKDGRAKLKGYVEDYANVCDGLLCLYSATGDVHYLDESRSLADTMIDQFWDGENGGLFFVAGDHEELIVRNKDLSDNATPSGNSVAADVFIRLTRLTGGDKYSRYAAAILRISVTQAKRFPQGFGRALSALDLFLSDAREVVIVGEQGNDLERATLEMYLPDTVVALLHEPSDSDHPLFAERRKVDGKPSAYVCRRFVCERPVTDVDELCRLLTSK